MKAVKFSNRLKAKYAILAHFHRYGHKNLEVRVKDKKVYVLTNRESEFMSLGEPADAPDLTEVEELYRGAAVRRFKA